MQRNDRKFKYKSESNNTHGCKIQYNFKNDESCVPISKNG